MGGAISTVIGAISTAFSRVIGAAVAVIYGTALEARPPPGQPLLVVHCALNHCRF